jgi:pSer/pThr/pTyr-binding forkhead associated (FHA) protein
MSNARLKVIEGKPLGATIPVSGPAFVIGRAPTCQLRPKHESVGEQHCRLRVAEKHVSVRDLGSAAGTTLNGRKLSPSDSVIAVTGDQLKVGNLVFEVNIDAPIEMVVRLEDALEDETPASAMANRLMQQHLADVPSSTINAAARLSLQVVEGLPVVTVLMAHVEGDSLVPFRRELRNLAERPSLKRLILDLHKVQSLSMDGAVMIHAFHVKLKERGACVKLCEVAPKVQKILDSEGVSELVPIAFDIHDAIWSSW